MTNENKNSNTKFAMVASVMSILLCLVILVGTTYAWFSDSATTGVNIKVGNLSVELIDSNEDQRLAFTEDENEIIWAPGVSHDLESFRIKNTGDLDLKYRLKLEGIDENLFDVDAKINGISLNKTSNEDGSIYWEDSYAALAAHGQNGTSSNITEPIVISLKMKNTANYADIENLELNEDSYLQGVSITVEATQLENTDWQ